MPAVPTVAIIGRPNVGKSTLFNRIVGKRKALVHDYPGVTRDRMIEPAEYGGFGFTLIDTGGFDPDSEDVIVRHINRQVQIASEAADLVLFIVDGLDGLTGTDHDCAELLRRLGKPVLVVVNKTERPQREMEGNEFYALGFPDIVFISAAHGTNVAEFLEKLLVMLPSHVAATEEEPPYCQLAVVGRPNVGKSSLVNALAGEERVIVTDIAGTTRDAVDTDFTYYKKHYRIIDTAGIRRQKKVTWALEKLSVFVAMKSMERADVVLLVLDASEEIAEQDLKIAGLAHESGKGVMIVVNKWDIPAKDTMTLARFTDTIRERFKFLPYAPVEYVSCVSGQRLHKVLETATRIRENQEIRIPTNPLNKILDDASRGIPPPRQGSRILKMYYATQVSSRPPTIVIFCNDPELRHFSYERYLQNQLRAHYPYEGLPLRIYWRAREQKERKQRQSASPKSGDKAGKSAKPGKPSKE